MQSAVAGRLAELLGDGPFLGNASTPTLAVLSAFPVVAGPDMLGLRGHSLVENGNRFCGWPKG